MQLAAAGARVTAVEVDADRALVMRANIARMRLQEAVDDGRGRRPRDGRPSSRSISCCWMRPAAPPAPSAATRTSSGASPPTAWRRLDGPAGRAAAGGEPHGGAGRPLVYAVCSLQPEEGPERIKAFLEREAGFVRDPIAREELLGLPVDLTPEGELRTLPCHLAEEGGMDGFFVARLRRS